MNIRNIRHKGLRRLVEYDDVSGLPIQFVDKIRNMIAFLQDMNDVSELQSFPHWKAHQLGGTRKGVWSLAVSRNWRLTFYVDDEFVEIVDLNYEDYH